MAKKISRVADYIRNPYSAYLCMVNNSRIAGFSLIEILIVIALIAIMSAIAISFIFPDKLKCATRMVFYDLQYARMHAIRDKNNYRVLFDNGNGHTYQILDDQDNDSNADPNENLVTRDIDTDYDGVTFNANANPTFNPVGTSNAGTITLTEGGDSKRVIFSWTGRIRIQ